jgi:hypothetical protein
MTATGQKQTSFTSTLDSRTNLHSIHNPGGGAGDNNTGECRRHPIAETPRRQAGSFQPTMM